MLFQCLSDQVFKWWYLLWTAPNTVHSSSPFQAYLTWTQRTQISKSITDIEATSDNEWSFADCSGDVLLSAVFLQACASMCRYVQACARCFCKQPPVQSKHLSSTHAVASLTHSPKVFKGFQSFSPLLLLLLHTSALSALESETACAVARLAPFIPHICHFFYTGKIFGE